ALGQLRLLLDEFPELPEGWAALAELCRKLNLPFEEMAARCAALEHGGPADPGLRERFGLGERLALREGISSGLRVDDTLLVGTRAGWIYEIDGRSLELVGKRRFPAAVKGLSGGALVRALLDDRTKVDVLDSLRQLEAADAPPEWHNLTGHDGR